MKNKVYQFLYCHKTGNKFLLESGWSMPAFFGGVAWAAGKGLFGHYSVATFVTAALAFASILLDNNIPVAAICILGLHWYIGESGNRTLMKEVINKWNIEFPNNKLTNMGGIEASSWNDACAQADNDIAREKEFAEILSMQDEKTIQQALGMLDELDGQSDRF
jgi:hypothetical protein